MNHRINRIVRQHRLGNEVSLKDKKIWTSVFKKKYDRGRRGYFQQCVSVSPVYVSDLGYSYELLKDRGIRARDHYSLRKYLNAINAAHEPST